MEKFTGKIFQEKGIYYLLLHRAALLSLLFASRGEWHSGCYYPGQTKWRASGRFRMDLTARDPPKVPRCILRRNAGVSEAAAEREPADEILSAFFARRISFSAPLCFLTLPSSSTAHMRRRYLFPAAGARMREGRLSSAHFGIPSLASPKGCRTGFPDQD
jgi:hypothetical protein